MWDTFNIKLTNPALHPVQVDWTLGLTLGKRSIIVRYCNAIGGGFGYEKISYDCLTLVP
jgi:hypothetical protein